jgi:NADH dehydrogenase
MPPGRTIYCRYPVSRSPRVTSTTAIFCGAGFRRAHVDFTRTLLATKGAAEELVRGTPRLNWTIFQPSVIFGPDDSLTRRFVRLLHLSAGVLPLARARARFAPIYVDDVAQAFVSALMDGTSYGRIYQLCGPKVLTLEEIIRASAAAANVRCHILRLPDALGRLQAAFAQLLPGQPFSLDNFRSLTVDNVCREDGCARLGIVPASLEALAPLWLAPQPLPGAAHRQ